MGKDRLKKLMLMIEADMSPFLEKYCFYHCDSRMWLRKWGWKSDVIMLYRRFSGVLINLCVWIPPEVGLNYEFDHEQIEMINLGTFMGKTSSLHDYPRWFGSLEKFRQNLIADLTKGVNWFDDFDTPSKCLEFVKENAIDIISPSTIYCQKYLSTLPPEVKNGGKFILSHEYPNEYSRALFDLGYTGRLPRIEGSDDVESDE